MSQNGFGEIVARGPAQRDPGIRQVGVDGEVPVARLVGAAASGRYAGTDQRDHQVGASGAELASVGDTTSATDTARTASSTQTRAADDNPNQL